MTTAVVRSEENGSFMSGPPVRASLTNDSLEHVRISSTTSSPRQRNRSRSLDSCAQGSNSVQERPFRGEYFIRKSWENKLRDFLHLPHQLPAGYTTDLHPNPEIPSLDAFQPGYGKVAAFETCDPSLAIYRKFSWLHNRALLHLQDELSELESELLFLDKYDFGDGDHVRLISRRHDYGILGVPKQSVRRELIQKINNKLKEYDELLLRTRKILALRRPSERAQRSLFSLIKNTSSLVKQETDWIRYSTDLAALTLGTEHGWLNDAIESTLNGISRRMTKFLFTTEEQRRQAGNEVIQLTSPERRDILLRIVLTILALVLLLVPVAILFSLQPSHQSEAKRKSNYQILTVFLFTLLFSTSCSVFTRARRHEVFGVTAAYCAVLVIFLGNTSNVIVATNEMLS